MAQGNYESMLEMLDELLQIPCSIGLVGLIAEKHNSISTELWKLRTLASAEYFVQESFFVQVFLPFSVSSDAFYSLLSRHVYEASGFHWAQFIN